MTTRDLEIFIAVAEHGNMSEAAKKLYIAPSAVSQTILDIEKEYNTTLFVRMNKKLHITEKGEMLLGYAHHMIALSDEIEHSLREDVQARIRIGVTATIGASMAGKIIHEYQVNNPDVAVELAVYHTGDILRYLQREELDLGLVIQGDYRHTDFVSIPMLTDRILLGCGTDHEFSSRTTVLPDELNGQPFILRQRASQMRAYYDSLISAYDIKPKELWVSSDALAQKNAVADNYGLALLSKCFAMPEERAGRIRLLEVSGMNYTRNFVLKYHKRKYLNPHLRCFIEVCQDYRKKIELLQWI